MLIRILKFCIILLLNIFFVVPIYAFSHDVEADIDIQYKENTDYIHYVICDDVLFVLVDDGGKFIDISEHNKNYTYVFQLYMPVHIHYDDKCITCLEEINNYIKNKVYNIDDMDMSDKLINIRDNNVKLISKIELENNAKQNFIIVAFSIFIIIMIIFFIVSLRFLF